MINPKLPKQVLNNDQPQIIVLDYNKAIYTIEAYHA